jgi:hypothetical protein
MLSMATPDINPLRDKARAKMSDGKLPKTTQEVERIVADIRNRPNSACAVCDIAISNKDFWFQVYHLGIAAAAIPRAMHSLCHAAWQAELCGLPRS